MNFLKTIPRAAIFTLALVAALIATFSFYQAAASAQGRVVASARGAGQLTFNGSLRTFAFTAREYSDGTVEGEGQLVVHVDEAPIIFHFEITCLRVEGNMATMAGTITNSNTPEREGRSVAFRVVDNGEGRNDPPAVMTVLQVAPPGVVNTSDYDFTGTPLRPIDGRNIQVSWQ